MAINNERLDKWILLLEGAKTHKSFHMKDFHSNQMKVRMSGTGLIKDQAAFYKKEYHACPGGLLAISEDWKTDGGTIGLMGEPMAKSANGTPLTTQESIAFWLGCSSITASTLIYGFVNDVDVNGRIFINTAHTFGSIWSKVSIDDALKLFNELKTDGEISYLKRVRVNVAEDKLTMQYMKDQITAALSQTITKLEEEGVTP